MRISLWITRIGTSTMLRSTDANAFQTAEKGESAEPFPPREWLQQKESPFAHRQYTAGLGRLSRRLSAGTHAAAICHVDPTACLCG